MVERPSGMLSPDELTARAASGEIDTVVAGFTDHHGRLCGKRFAADFFLEHVAAEGTHGCDYLLTTDLEMEPVPGYDVRRLGPRLRRRPPRARPRHAARRPTGSIAARSCSATSTTRPPTTLTDVAPRTILRRQVDRLGEAGFSAMAATELEHYLFRTSYRDAAAGGHADLEPAGWYLEDYQLQQGARTEDFHAAVRRHLAASGVPVESSKGEWGLGQHEVNVRYGDILEAADRHAVFKQCLKETADRHGVSVTFMAKPHADRAGSSCHVHLSLWRDGRNAFAGDDDLGVTRHARIEGAALVPRRLPALGARAGGAARSHGELLQAVRRRVLGADPTRVELRQPHRRVPAGRPRPEPPHRVPHPRRRLQPLPGARRPGRVRAGRDRAADRAARRRSSAMPTAPSRCPRSRARCAMPPMPSRSARWPARRWGPTVVEHYVHAFRTEQAAFDAAVTDWERQRYFERI